MVLRQRETRLALAGLCLAALSASAGATLFAAEAQKPSSVEADPIGQSAGVDAQAKESELASHGGALYSPFSSALDTAPSRPHTNATPTRQNVDEGSPDLTMATVTAIVAAGVLVVLVRVLFAS